MAALSSEKPDRRLIDDAYLVDSARPLPGAGGGDPAFAVLDRNGAPTGLMAVQVARGRPPRSAAIQAATGMADALLAPLAHGPAGTPASEEYYIVCRGAPGPAVNTARVWSEAELLDCLLRPAAQALAALVARGITHRAIRPENVFQAAPGQPAVLGQAWSGPPAARQPALFEPPYSAMCLPQGRGDGGIADDVYALGVLLVVLALGRGAANASDDAAAVVRRKLEHGSFAAVAGEARLPPIIADLARGMLAEDPEHRPTPALLLEPAAARARRLAARPPKRAQNPLRVGAWEAWDARALAHAIAVHPQPGLALLRNGTVDLWLRRGIGDAALAGRLDDVVRTRPAGEPEAQGDALLVMRSVAVLDPLAPLCWRGLALWPSGVGPALAAVQAGAAGEAVATALLDLIAGEAAVTWAGTRLARADAAPVPAEARRWRTLLAARGATGGVRRLVYALNPLLPCASPLLAGRAAARSADLVAALEARAERSDGVPEAPPVDAEIAAFAVVRAERPSEAETASLAAQSGPRGAVARLEMLATLQDSARTRAPALARWLIADPDLLASWHNNAARAELTARLTALASAGQLRPLLALLRDPAARAADTKGAKAAAAQLAALDAEIARIEAGRPQRERAAGGLGQEVAAGIALAGLALSLMRLAVG